MTGCMSKSTKVSEKVQSPVGVPNHRIFRPLCPFRRRCRRRWRYSFTARSSKLLLYDGVLVQSYVYTIKLCLRSRIFRVLVSMSQFWSRYKEMKVTHRGIWSYENESIRDFQHIFWYFIWIFACILLNYGTHEHYITLYVQFGSSTASWVNNAGAVNSVSTYVF